MRSLLLAATLAAIASVSALPLAVEPPIAALPRTMFQTTKITPITPEEARAKLVTAANATKELGSEVAQVLHSRDSCSNLLIRTEWDSFPDSSKQKFIDAVKCLMRRPPSGQFSQSRSRYEDLVALHQTLTPEIHGNDIFLPWHRGFTQGLQRLLTNECGYTLAIPWFDETRHAGHFRKSNLFSNRWLGSITPPPGPDGGHCVTDGQFANQIINVGPGLNNIPHCLSRAGDASQTINCNQDYVDTCNAYTDFHTMSNCAEYGVHAWAHTGIGFVMQDLHASPADLSFFFIHAAMDRHFRLWQKKDQSRLQTISGHDHRGNPLTLDTTIDMLGVLPTMRIGEILDTTAPPLCYKYNY